MKKILSLLLAATITFGLCACGNVKTGNTTSNDTALSNSNSKEEEKRYVAYEFDGKTNDALTVEEVVLMPPENSSDLKMCGWRIKVRNTSGKDLKMKESSMEIWYQYLDDNGDKLYVGNVSGGYTSTVKVGEAEWIEGTRIPASWTNEDIEKMAKIKIYAYATTLHGSPDHEFSEPIIVNIKDYIEW